MDARVRNQSLVEGRVDAITGFASSALGAIGAVGRDMRFMLYSDYGIVLYGNIVLAVPPKMLEQNAAMCQALADGLMAGLKFTLTKPAEAQEMFLNSVPELKMTPTAGEFARLGMGVQRFSVLAGGPEVRAQGLGYANHDKLDKMTDFVLKYQAEAGAKKPDLKALFTNQFVGKIKLTDAEWKTAEKETEWVGPKLGKKT